MRFSEGISRKLAAGDWIFDKIGPAFHRRLSSPESKTLGEKSVTERCIAYYTGYPLREVSVETEFAFANVSSRVEQGLEKAFQSDYPKAKIVQPEHELQKRLVASLNLVKSKNPEAYSLVQQHIGFCRLSNVGFRSASHPHFFGLVIFGDRVLDLSEKELAISILHEMAHQELFLVNLIDRLVVSDFDHHEIHAPFQGKSRPPIGRLHSLWALYRMIQFQKFLGDVDRKHLSLLKDNAVAFAEGELTPFAQNLVEIARKRSCP